MSSAYLVMTPRSTAPSHNVHDRNSPIARERRRGCTRSRLPRQAHHRDLSDVFLLAHLSRRALDEETPRAAGDQRAAGAPAHMDDDSQVPVQCSWHVLQ